MFTPLAAPPVLVDARPIFRELVDVFLREVFLASDTFLTFFTIGSGGGGGLGASGISGSLTSGAHILE